MAVKKTTKSKKAPPAVRLTERTLARDVLKWLGSKQMIVETGQYCRISSDSEIESLVGQSFQKVLQRKKIPITCSVCAMGALLIASVDRRNKLKFNPKGYGSYTIISHLSDVISEDELRLIETAFEGNRVEGPKTEHDESAVEFYDRILNPTERLAAIMRNIVKHGVFKPEEEAWKRELNWNG